VGFREQYSLPGGTTEADQTWNYLTEGITKEVVGPGKLIARLPGGVTITRYSSSDGIGTPSIMVNRGFTEPPWKIRFR